MRMQDGSIDCDDELEAFLKSTDGLATHADRTAGESDEEEYESDGGTRYVRDSSTGRWVHEDLASKKDGPKEERKPNVSQSSAAATMAAMVKPAACCLPNSLLIWDLPRI